MSVSSATNQSSRAPSSTAGERRGTSRDLFNAAPDLYEALIAALPYVECELDNAAYKRGAVAKAVAAMNAAIAKAEGRS